MEEGTVRKPGILSEEAVEWFFERDAKTLSQAVSFVPWVIQRGIRLGTVSESKDSVVIYRGEGAVVFCDASGFTKLTEYLAQKPNGAELLSKVLNQFFTPLIDIINAYRGDIIKFSGDALTILFLAEPDDFESTSEFDLPCGSGWARCEGHSDIQLAALRASACCLEIHKRLDNYDTGIPDRTLSFHIGVGCGQCAVLHVGGECSPDDFRLKRFEYVICGEPLEQIAHACHYAEVYETVLSPQAWELVKETVVEGAPIHEDPTYHKLAGFLTSKHTYATIRSATQSRDVRAEKYALKPNEINLARRYIPSAVYMQMENGTLEYVNEIRNVTVFFICVAGLDVSTPDGAVVAQDLMASVQLACFEQEGQVNKFLVDDKGLLFLCLFGTPPMVHTDDPLRAIHACHSIIHALRRLGLQGYIGLSTGRVFCGVVGSSARMEYTCLGDSVNLAARFMQLSKPNVVLVDEATFNQTKEELEYEVLEPVRLKGKANAMPVFQPRLKMTSGLEDVVGGSISPTSARSPGFREAQAPDIPSMDVVNEEAGRNGRSAPVGTRMQRKTTQMVEILANTREGSSSSKKDPLLQCNLWEELAETKQILHDFDIAKNGGTLVFSGPAGLGKERLCQVVLHTVRKVNRSLATVYATDQGRPRDRARPVVELIESCLEVAKLCGLMSKSSDQTLSGPGEPHKKLVDLSKLINAPLDELLQGGCISEETGRLEIPQLNAFMAPSDDNEPIQNRRSPTRRGSDVLMNPNIFSAPLPNSPYKHNDGVTSTAIPASPSQKPQLIVPMEEQFLGYAERVLRRVLSIRPMAVVMQISRGTSIFNLVPNSTFWKLFERLCRLASDADNSNPLVLILLCRRPSDVGGVVSLTHIVSMKPLPKPSVEEYVGLILRLSHDAAEAIPPALIDFVFDLTGGNPLYIMETLDQLVQRNIITKTADGFVKVDENFGATVNVAEWSHTSMVGHVICQLESLAPQETAIVKMATVFNGPFSVLDVAASLKSPYTNARRFDNYLMYKTCEKLAKGGILSEIPREIPLNSQLPVNDMGLFPKDTRGSFMTAVNKIPMFVLDNFLVRRVAGGMILQQQALKVKRQAMMYRVIHKEVPNRLEAQRRRTAGLHMPYYNLVKL